MREPHPAQSSGLDRARPSGIAKQRDGRLKRFGSQQRGRAHRELHTEHARRFQLAPD